MMLPPKMLQGGPPEAGPPSLAASKGASADPPEQHSREMVMKGAAGLTQGGRESRHSAPLSASLFNIDEGVLMRRNVKAGLADAGLAPTPMQQFQCPRFRPGRC